MKRLIKVLLAIGLFAMGLMMAVFALAGLQTIVWCRDECTPIPWQVWPMLGTVTVWCVLMANVSNKTLKDIDSFFTKLTKE